MKNKKAAFRRILPLFLAMALCITTQDVTLFAAEIAETGLKSKTAELSLEEYVVAALENHQTMIDVSAYDISVSAAGREYFKILRNNPQLFYVMALVSQTYEGNRVKYYWPEYLAKKDEVMEMREELEAAVQPVLEQVDESMDAVQKALVVHDYLVQNCEYDQEGFTAGSVPAGAYTAYSALVEGMAVCDGYANAYAYIMKHKLGIPCTVVRSGSMSHSWNMIEIDGKWYHVDVTWDDPVWDCIGRVHHEYFLLSDGAISQNSPNEATGNGNHYAWTSYYNYTADSEQYDREFWRGVESAISYYNGAWYYSEYESAGNRVVLRKKADLFDTDTETVYQASPWQASGQDFYSASFMYLAQADRKLYFSTSTAIMQMDAGGDVQVFYEPDDLAGKQIFGFTAKDGGFLYAPNDAPPSGKQSDIRWYSPSGEAPPSQDPDDPPETPSPEDSDAAFWAYVEERKQELQEYKDTVIAELNDKYASKVGSYHYTDFNDELRRLIDNAIDEINRIDIGVYYEPVSGDKKIVKTLRECVETIHGNLTRTKAKIDEQVNLFDWSDLVDVWKAAKEELDNYKNPNDYRTAQQKELKAAIEAGKAAIDEAKTAAYVDGNPTSHDPVSAKKEVEKAFQAAKAEIDKIKTDAQLKKEEENKKPGTGLSLNKTNVTLYTGKASKTVTVKATVTGGTSKAVTWKTSNPKVATVKNGKITAVGKGTATITATAKGISKTVKVTVKNPALTIKKGSKKFTKSKLTVKGKKEEVLTVTVSPKDSGISITKLTAKQKKIASVTLKKGKITIKGKKKGSFTLQIKSGKTTKNIKITVM